MACIIMVLTYFGWGTMIKIGSHQAKLVEIPIQHCVVDMDYSRLNDSGQKGSAVSSLSFADVTMIRNTNFFR